MDQEPFYQDLMNEIRNEADALEDFYKSVFLQKAVNEIVEIGDLDDESIEPCTYTHDELKMELDGFQWEDENTICLFLVDFHHEATPATLTKQDLNRSLMRMSNVVKAPLARPDLYANMEESFEIYDLIRQLSDSAVGRREEIYKVKLFLISNRKLSSRINEVVPPQIANLIVVPCVYDLTRLQRIRSGKSCREAMIINLEEEQGKPIPCLPANNSENYKSYICVVEGQFLSNVYAKYGARLLEQNVRCFLQAMNKVNKGIRNTIRNEPGMFFAYNNGLTATASKIEFNDEGSIIEITDFQIVNGGQTTASIFTTGYKDKADLSEIKVQMKISEILCDDITPVVSNISQYANTQNKVNAADFFSNHPYHVRIENFSRNKWTALPGRQKEAKWFYERARGQYRDHLANLTPAQRKKREAEYPKERLFTKTDLAKYQMSWERKPYVASYGAQKCFAKFAEKVGTAWDKSDTQFSEQYYRKLIALAIIYKRLEKLILKQEWYGGYRLNIIVYTIAALSWIIEEKFKKSLNIERLWKDQSLSHNLESFLLEISTYINGYIQDEQIRGGVKNVTEWCKKEACWTKLIPEIERRFCGDLGSISEYFESRASAQRKKKEASSDQKLLSEFEKFNRVVNEVSPQTWKVAHQYGLQEKIINGQDDRFLKIASNIPLKMPDEKQAVHLSDLLDRLVEAGFKLPD
jgi:hypothetical protein